MDDFASVPGIPPITLRDHNIYLGQWFPNILACNTFKAKQCLLMAPAPELIAVQQRVMSLLRLLIYNSRNLTKKNYSVFHNK